MASKYNALSGIAYYGFPIFYRVECRSGHPTIILSYRKDGRIVYEHPPRRIKDIPFDSLPEELLEEFFQIFFLWSCPQSSGSVGCSFAGHWLIFRWQLFSQPTHIHYFTILI